MTENKNPYLLTPAEIKNKLEEIEPDGFDWTSITDTEMIKFLTISKATHDKMIRRGWIPPREPFDEKFERQINEIYKE